MKSVSLVALFAGIALASPSKVCQSIKNCAFDEVCHEGFCERGNVALQNRAVVTDGPIFTLCTQISCGQYTDLIAESKFPLEYNAFSPAYTAGVPPGYWIHGWRIQGPFGVTVIPEGGVGGYGWQTNSVAIRSYYAGDAITHEIKVQPYEPVVVYFSAMSAANRPPCYPYPETPTLYVKADDAYQKTYIVSRDVTSFERQDAYVFRPTSERVTLTFSTNNQGVDGCSPLIYDVHATQDTY